MASLTEMLDYIEQRMQAGSQGRVHAEGVNIGLVVEGLPPLASPPVATVFDPEHPQHSTPVSSANARNIAAMLNAAPGIVAAARQYCEHGEIAQEVAAMTLLTPLYEEMKRQEEM